VEFLLLLFSRSQAHGPCLLDKAGGNGRNEMTSELGPAPRNEESKSSEGGMAMYIAVRYMRPQPHLQPHRQPPPHHHLPLSHLPIIIFLSSSAPRCFPPSRLPSVGARGGGDTTDWPEYRAEPGTAAIIVGRVELMSDHHQRRPRSDVVEWSPNRQGSRAGKTRTKTGKASGGRSPDVAEAILTLWLAPKTGQMLPQPVQPGLTASI
jgi:hypothetical protein